MKKLLALLLAALMVFGMAACAKTAETPAADTPAGETTATADKPAEETTADETPAESDGDKIVIHYWAQWTENEAQAEVYKAAIAHIIRRAAESRNPEDKTLMWFCRPHGTHCLNENQV
ncbi:MAG: hypothetical protein KH756_08865, partial [Firmicutes bacterium]|nr:hypothetical protein [Bacillota bacterium]